MKVIVKNDIITIEDINITMVKSMISAINSSHLPDKRVLTPLNNELKKLIQ